MITSHNIKNGEFDLLLQGNVSGSLSDNFITELFSIKLHAKKINVYINVNKTDLSSALAIHDALKIIQCHVCCIGLGTIPLTALPILLAGDKRLMTSNAFIQVCGLSDNLVAERGLSVNIRESLENLLKETTKMSQEDQNRMLSKRWMMTSKDSLDYGIITGYR